MSPRTARPTGDGAIVIVELSVVVEGDRFNQ